MSTKKTSTSAFHLANIELVNITLNISETFKPTNDYQFQVQLESRLNEDSQMVIVTNQVSVFNEENQPAVGELIAKYWFDISQDTSWFLKDKKTLSIIPEQLQLSFNAIALSTTRGLLFSSFRGTLLHNAILPVIDPVQFSK
ncbi:hypothetical protein EON73_01960 [bacterium]|nr:MAG: hypothetical protein EON73_01960 [bacterium]